jgi:signal transduction histidine kinase
MRKKEFFRYWFSDHLILAGIIFSLIYQAVDISLNYFVSGELKREGIGFYLTLGGIEDLIRFFICFALFMFFGIFVKNIILDLRQTHQDKAENLNENINKIKNFAYAVAHDVKNPAINIYAWVKLLSKKYHNQFDDEGKHYLDSLEKNAQNIATMVGDINIFIETMELPLNFENVDVKKELAFIRNGVNPILDLRQIQWLEPKEIPRIRADRMSIYRILRNLIDNALKHGGDDLRQITFEYLEIEKFCVFKVIDDGCGIDESEHDEVFEAFSRPTTSEKIEGSGLGLSIVKELVEKHGGKISVDSLPNKGTCFTFTILKKI